MRIHRVSHWKTLLALGAWVVVATPVLAAEPEWAERYASADGRKDEVADVVTDDQGNVYVTGSSGFNPLDSWNVLTVSYGPDGSERWVDVYDGGNQDLGVELTFDEAGDLLVIGRSNSNFLVLRYDPATGQRLDAFEHDPGGLDSPTAVATDAAGNLYVTGSSWPGGSDNQNDYYTVKLDPLGNELWSARYNGPGAFLFAHDVPYDVELDAAGDVFVTGYSNAPGTATGDFYTVKYGGDDGQVLWSDRYSAGSNEGGYKLVVGGDGDVFVTGGSYQSGFKFVTLRYDGSTGNREWIATDAPAACSVATEIGLDTAGDVYVSGWADPDCDESNFNEDIATLKYAASDGARQWTTLYGNPAVGFFDVPYDLGLDAADNVYVTGGNTGLIVLLRYDPASGAIADVDTIDSGANEYSHGAALAIDSANDVLVAAMARNVNTEDRDYLTIKYPAAAPVTLFADGFESGDTSAWSATVP
jgi:hypothetical protein